MSKTAPFETFAALDAIPWIRHGFIQRVDGIDTKVDRSSALAALADIHRDTLSEIGIDPQKSAFIAAEQVHGHRVERVDGNTVSPVPETDGLITVEPGVCLAIYVADCGPIYLVDRRNRAIGLLHSGKKGTEQNILGAAIDRMKTEFGTDSTDLLAVLGPCIRPPHYDIDFAAAIGRQAHHARVGEYIDPGTCTASDPQKYYSYRRELGKTGRLLAVLAIN
ncbi:MAG TPA: polyphenol oxidase family protein [Chthoniobacterales bacterium]